MDCNESSPVKTDDINTSGIQNLKTLKGQKRCKGQEVASSYETRSKKKIKSEESNLFSKSKSLSPVNDEENAGETSPERRTHQDSDGSFVSTTDQDDDQKEDFAVDNLIKELSDLIRSCGKGEHANKEFYPQKSNKQNVFDSTLDESCFKKYQNKRKSRKPKKKTRRKLEMDVSAEKKNPFSPDKSYENISGEECSDGEVNLTIVEEKKRRRKTSSSLGTEIPNEVMEFIVKSSIDDKLQSIALREKLTEGHVKNIIKQVITDKSVLAMLRNSIYGIDFENPLGTPVFEPKLTRAKTKELYEQQMKAGAGDEPSFQSLWTASGNNMEAMQTATHSLVTEEFPEEEDDEEYQPDLDEQMMSDEESMLSSFRSPSITPSNASTRLQGCTPSSTTSITPRSVTTPFNSLTIIKTAKGEKRAVQRTLNFAKEEPSLICTRTRSKYPMTDTPLEYLEMAFKPPDITADMYETEIDDEDWKKFLLDFSQPQDVMKGNDDDEQVDPEYNLMADAEEEDPTLDDLREELRGDKAVRISKKEVNELMMEFLDSFNVASDDDDAKNINKSKNSISQQLMESNCSNFGAAEAFDLSDPILLPEDSQILDQAPPGTYFLLQPSTQPPEEKVVQNQVNDSDPIVVTFLAPEFSKEHMEVLNCQMAQHTQLLTQSLLMTSYSDKFRYIENGTKEMLNEMFNAGNLSGLGSRSFFHPFNLTFALETLTQYDAKREEFQEYRKEMKNVRAMKYGCKMRNCRSRLPPFPPLIQNLFLESSAFPYIHLLPSGLFHEIDWRCRKAYQPGEYLLLAVAFSEVVTDRNIFVITSNRLISPFPFALTKACRAVVKQSCVFTRCGVLNRHLRKLLIENYCEGEHEDNPLVLYAKTGKVEMPKARVDRLSKSVPCPLKNMDIKFLPFIFNRMVRKYWKNHQKNESSKPLGQPIEPISSPVQPSSNILIIQDGASTQIILPTAYSTTPHTIYLTTQEEGSFSQPSPPPSSLPAPSTVAAPIFPSFEVHRNKPVNTVAPTPIINTVSSSNISTVPQTPNFYPSLPPPPPPPPPPPLEPPARELCNPGYVKPFFIIPPSLPSSSVSSCSTPLTSLSTSLPPKLPAKLLHQPQKKKDNFGIEFSNQFPIKKQLKDLPPRPNLMTSHLRTTSRSFHPSEAAAPSPSSVSPSKITSSLLSDAPNTPLLHMPFLIDTPCKSEIPKTTHSPSSPPAAGSITGAAETPSAVGSITRAAETPPEAETNSARRNLLTSKVQPSEINSYSCSPQRETPLGSLPSKESGGGSDSTGIRVQQSSSQLVQNCQPLQLSPTSDLNPSPKKKLRREWKVAALKDTVVDQSIDKDTSFGLPCGNTSEIVNTSEQEVLYSSGENGKATPLPFPQTTTKGELDNDSLSDTSKGTPKKRKILKKLHKTMQKMNSTKKNKSETTDDGVGLQGDGKSEVVMQNGEGNCSQAIHESNSDKKENEPPEGGPEGDIQVRQTEEEEVTTKTVKLKRKDRKGEAANSRKKNEKQDFFMENKYINKKKENKYINKRKKRDNEKALKSKTTEKRKKWERNDTLVKDGPSINEEDLDISSPEEKESRDAKHDDRELQEGSRENLSLENSENGFMNPDTEVEEIDDRKLQEGRRENLSLENSENCFMNPDTEVERIEGKERGEDEEEVKELEEQEQHQYHQQEETLEIIFFQKVKEKLAMEDPSKFLEFLSILRAFASRQDTEVVYFEVIKILWGFPDLQLEFLILLNPDQAKRVGKYSEYCVMQCFKKLFDASLVSSSCCNRDKTEVMRVLQHDLGQLEIPKDRVFDILKPFLALQPDIVRSIMDSFPQDGESSQNSEDNSNLSHEKYEEKSSKGSFSTTDSLLTEETSFSPQNEPSPVKSYSKESICISYSDDKKAEEENGLHTEETERHVDNLPTSGTDKMDVADDDSLKSSDLSSSWSGSAATPIKNASNNFYSRRRRGRSHTKNEESKGSPKMTPSDYEENNNRSQSFSRSEESSTETEENVKAKNESLKSKRMTTRLRVVDTAEEIILNKEKPIQGNRRDSNKQKRGEKTVKERSSNKSSNRKAKVNRILEEKIVVVDVGNKTKGRKRKNSKEQKAKLKENRKINKTLKKEKDLRGSRTKTKMKNKATKKGKVTWTKEEDLILINSVKSAKGLTPYLLRMLTDSLDNKTKDQVKERLNFIVKIFAQFG